MKLVILNKNDGKGGAARAASMWHKAMLKNGIDSSFFVENVTASIPGSLAPKSKPRKIYNYFKTHFDDNYLNWKYPNRDKYPWGINVLPTNVHHEINALRPDLVNLHWISNETISWNEIAKIEAPIAWTMHDMWALTGGCHYSYGCDKYQSHCGACPQLKSQKTKDLSYKIFDKKIELIQKKKITVIASSVWLHDCFKASPVFGNLDIHIVPNPMDTDVFKPIDKSQARNVLNLPQDKKLILFMAFSATTDPRKGVQYLPSMLEELENTYSTDELELVVVGAASNNGSIKTKFNTHFLGTISDDWSLTLLYSACDTMIAPSTEENLSLAVMESMSCGTPVVAFDIGGMPDMIKHNENGYLAKAFDSVDLANGIKTAIGNKLFSKNAREHVLKNYNFKTVFDRAIEIYTKCLQSK